MRDFCLRGPDDAMDGHNIVLCVMRYDHRVRMTKRKFESAPATTHSHNPYISRRQNEFLIRNKQIPFALLECESWFERRWTRTRAEYGTWKIIVSKIAKGWVRNSLSVLSELFHSDARLYLIKWKTRREREREREERRTKIDCNIVITALNWRHASTLSSSGGKWCVCLRV